MLSAKEIIIEILKEKIETLELSIKYGDKVEAVYKQMTVERYKQILALVENSKDLE